MPEHKHTNRLINETSPYLLQHAHNPVEWHPWGQEALERAQKEDKPILLSIGYSACHWCHVMERESFENDAIAELMNKEYISIKVDREERPDLDEIYMNAVQMLTGSGGWPLTVFLTPDGKPFFGGTYFPPVDFHGRPGFKTVLARISDVFREQRSQVTINADALTERIQSFTFVPPSGELISTSLIRDAVRELSQQFDSSEGGFTPAPKFPPSGVLSVLLRHHYASEDSDALRMAELTLDKMAAGGMYDHIGGGFHRYSTDERWLVPHFEKMLYDNALLARTYLEAYQVTAKDHYARVARETLEYVLGEMQSPEGGYYSSQDADTEGVEGKFYVWSHEEIERLLEDRAEAFCRFYDVTGSGNWEGTNILNRPAPIEDVARELDIETKDLETTLEEARRKLYAERDRRIKPGLDDKVLTSWNALMIVAMARGYRVLGEERFLESARRAARFILDHMVDEGRLLATYRESRARFNAYLDDYAYLLGALVELYESDFDIAWLDSARSLAVDLERLFWDQDQGGFFFTGADHESLLVRTKTGFDGAIPAGNAVAATYLHKLASYTGEESFAARAQETVRTFHSMMQRSPSAFPQMLCAVDYYLGSKREIAVVGPGASEESRRALDRIWQIYSPNAVVAFLDPDSEDRQTIEAKVPLLAGKSSHDNKTRFYICENYTCQTPTDRVSDVETALRSKPTP
jgi:uncharacterized protein YyaL (SSP411 family)